MSSAARASGLSAIDFALLGQIPAPADSTERSKSSQVERGSANRRSRSAKVASGSGSGSMNTCMWLNAPTSRMWRESSIPFPNTSPPMSPTPTAVKSVLWQSMPSARKWRLTDSQPPRAVIPIPLWS